MKTSRFLRNALIKWIVKWGTQESHLKEKKYGNIGTDLQLQEDTFFIIESAKFVLFIFFFFWLVFLFCSFTHGLFLFWHRREKRGNTCTRVNTINKIKVFHRKPVRKPFDMKKIPRESNNSPVMVMTRVWFFLKRDTGRNGA